MPRLAPVAVPLTARLRPERPAPPGSGPGRVGGGLGGPAMIASAAACWGTIGLAMSFLPREAGSVQVAAVRTATGGGLFLALALLVRRDEVLRLGRSRRDLAVVLLAGLAIASYQPLFLYGLAHAGVAIGSVICDGAMPAITGAIAAIGASSRPGRSWVAGSALAVAGCAALTLRDLAVGGGLPSGALAALLAAGAWAVFTLSSRTVIRHGHCPTVTMAVAFAVAAVLLSPVLAIRSSGWVLCPQGCLGALYLGAIATVGAYLLYGRGLRTTSAAVAGSLVLAEPLSAALVGIALLGERPDLVQVVGLVLLGLGLVAVALPRRVRAG